LKSGDKSRPSKKLTDIHNRLDNTGQFLSICVIGLTFTTITIHGSKNVSVVLYLTKRSVSVSSDLKALYKSIIIIFF